jgi:hypothetical protein
MGRIDATIGISKPRPVAIRIASFVSMGSIGTPVNPLNQLATKNPNAWEKQSPIAQDGML